ncbi:hypothetical protein [Nocardia sp. CA-290969]|uniref:hypothetical protein n=1 Tax=Nocardia sp. CA-290969 TaxID=3239986 RepID=UPI003D8DE873
MPADAAAEHTTSDTTAGTDAESPAKTETPGSGESAGAGAEKSGDPDATVKVEKAADPDATVKVEKAADPDATVKVDKPADPDATVKVEKAADPDATEKAAKAGTAGDETVVLGKSAATSPAGPDSEKSGSTEAKESSGLRKRFPLPVLAGAAVLLIAALVAVGVFFFLAGDRQEELDRRAAATKAACDFGNSFATYTGDKADDYVQRLEQNATGKWKDLVSQIGPDLKARFAETKVNSTAADVQCGYESGSGDKARVVLVIDQQFTTVGGPQQQAPGRVKVAANVDMEKVDGTWLVANFDTPMMQQ